MKKVFICFVLALVANALVSCNNNADTTVITEDTLEIEDTLSVDSADTLYVDTVI